MNKTQIKEIKWQNSVIKTRNLNDIYHLHTIKNHLQNSDINWSFHLREYDTINRNNLFKINNLKPPKFYYTDELKYKEKNKKIKSNSMENIFNYTLYKHLLFNNENKINNNTFYFERSLRNLKMNNSTNQINNWNNTINKNIISSLNYLPLTKGLNDNIIIRPYNIKLKEQKYGKNKIYIKQLIRNNNYAMNYFGSHNSGGPYKNFCLNKNYSELKNILIGKNKSRIQCYFQLTLRNQLKN